MLDMRKVAIIGCGFVGASTAFALMRSGLFSEMVLLDIDEKKAEGEAMDLSHGLPFNHPMKIYAGDYSDLNDCPLIIITAGAAQKPGQTRLDLVHTNVGILRSILDGITAYNTECTLLILSNPVDILTYAALKLTGFPENRVFGSGTVLDSARLKYLLGQHMNIDLRNVHAFIIGEHGDSELPVWSSANVSGCDLPDFCGICGSCEGMQNMYRLFEEVRDSGYEIQERKEATYYGIAMSTMRIVEAIVRDEHSVLPVSAMVHDFCEIDDVCLGIPSVVGSDGVEKVLHIPLSDDERLALMKSAQKLKEVIRELGL